MKKQLIRFIISSYVILLAGLLVPSTKSLFLLIAPFYALLIIGILIYYVRYTRTARSGKRQLAFFVGLAAVTILLERFAAPVSNMVYSFVPVNLSEPQSLWTILLMSINWTFIIYCSAALCFPIRNRFFHILAASFLVVIYYLLLAQTHVAFFQMEWPSVFRVDLSFQVMFIFAVFVHTVRVLLRIQVKNVLANVTYATKAVCNALFILLNPLIG